MLRPARENGWQGGVVAKGKRGLLIAAFIGAVSEDDVKVSKAGLAVLVAFLFRVFAVREHWPQIVPLAAHAAGPGAAA